MKCEVSRRCWGLMASKFFFDEPCWGVHLDGICSLGKQINSLSSLRCNLSSDSKHIFMNVVSHSFPTEPESATKSAGTCLRGWGPQRQMSNRFNRWLWGRAQDVPPWQQRLRVQWSLKQPMCPGGNQRIFLVVFPSDVGSGRSGTLYHYIFMYYCGHCSPFFFLLLFSVTVVKLSNTTKNTKSNCCFSGNIQWTLGWNFNGIRISQFPVTLPLEIKLLFQFFPLLSTHFSFLDWTWFNQRNGDQQNSTDQHFPVRNGVQSSSSAARCCFATGPRRQVSDVGFRVLWGE